MTLQHLINNLMGVKFETREPATFNAPELCKCPITNCEEYGKWIDCYSLERMPHCPIYSGGLHG